MKKIIREIKVSTLGEQEIKIPIITLKSDIAGKKVLFISGIHGNELSGLFILNKLVPKIIIASGEVNIITVANPLAMSVNQRESPTDKKDLNRVFPGNATGNISERIAFEIFNFAKTMDIVIDLHTFEDPCPIVGIFMNTGTVKVRETSLKLLKAFNPEAVWKITFTESEAELSGALGPKLCLQGIANFAIETPEHFRITEAQLELVVDKLINVLVFTANILGTVKNSEDLKIYKRVYVKADTTGIFESPLKLFQKVKKGEKLGKLSSIINLEKEDILSPCDGEVLIVKNREKVSTGIDLVSIGVLDSI